MKRNVESFGSQFGEHVVVIPRAITLEGTGGVVPVTHEESHHVVTLLFKQIGCHARIHTS